MKMMMKKKIIKKLIMEIMIIKRLMMRIKAMVIKTKKMALIKIMKMVTPSVGSISAGE